MKNHFRNTAQSDALNARKNYTEHLAMFIYVRKKRVTRFTILQALCTTLFLLTIAACLNNDSLSNRDSNPKNLILNSSFEVDNNPTLEGWITDSSQEVLVKDAPPRGGRWSIKLEAGWAPEEGLAETYISGESGKNIYHLTVWTKTLRQWTGTISLGIRKSGQTVLRKSAGSNASLWTSISLSDTLSVGRTDSIIVRLSAGMTEVIRGEALFDLIKLERIPMD